MSQIRVFLTSYVMHTIFQESLVFYLLSLYLLNIFNEFMDFISQFFKSAFIQTKVYILLFSFCYSPTICMLKS